MRPPENDMTTFPTRVQDSFAAEASSVAAARRFARRSLEAWGAPDLLDAASLVVSELVTNAVVHAGTPARLSLTLHGDQLRIEVEDRHPARRVPALTEPPPETSEGGRG